MGRGTLSDYQSMTVASCWQLAPDCAWDAGPLGLSFLEDLGPKLAQLVCCSSQILLEEVMGNLLLNEGRLWLP